MIALDLDGTLALENHQVSPKTRDALSELHSGGVEVVIATGRRYRTTRFVIENLELDVFAVCNGGALVKTPDQQTLHANTFNVSSLAHLAREIGSTLFAQRDAHLLDGADFVIDEVPEWNQLTQKHYTNNQQWSGKADLGSGDEDYLVTGAFNTEAELIALVTEIHKAFPETYNTIIVPHLETDYFYCEITPQHVNKWHGLSQINQHLAIHADHVCTVGDELNDMAMITAAGHGFAMANGHQNLKDAANFVCGHNQEDGIVEVVNYINELNQKTKS
jgi:Cof subfamily protein (haloacid dehalogenase superfamily)